MVRAASVLGIGFFATLLVGFLGIYHTSHPAVQVKPGTAEEYHQSITEIFISNINVDYIKQNLRLFTTAPHPAGTRANKKVAENIVNLWRTSGLQDVHYVPYDVLLSYPDYDRPNKLEILDNTGKTLYITKGVSPPIITDEQSADGAGIQWVAYSGDGTVQGQVVYCHYGRRQDFERLLEYGISLEGRIALIRYGRGFRGEKIWLAEKYGAIGAILFSDPQECARMGTNKDAVYPNTEWMPNEGAQRGSVMHGKGDPLTPLYPSKKDLFRSKTIEQRKLDGSLPSIPVIPLSYSDAYQLLSRMGGSSVFDEWQGGLNITYRLGPQLVDNGRVRLTVHSSLEIRTIRNVVGYIHGVEDTDRYVILGNHFDAWAYGSVDPNSGTAVLTEVARAIVQTINETNWRPARTIMFCSWDAEEHGLIGSTEFVEEFSSILNQRAIVYLNVDNIHSNQSLHVSTVPTVYQVVTEISKRIPNPMVSERESGRNYIYDTWIKTFPNEIKFRPDAPKMPLPGAGSDHESFLNFLGIPVVDFSYKNATTYGSYPLYHTLYETPFMNEHIFDTNNFSVHAAVGQYWGCLALQFADMAIIPLNVTDFASAILSIYVPDLKQTMDKLKNRQDLLGEARRQLSHLIRNCWEFLRSAKNFEVMKKRVLRSFSINPFDQRRISLINDRIMLVDRCFINPRGRPKEPSKRHVLFSFSDENSYAASTMSFVYEQIDAFRNAVSDKQRKQAAKNIAEQISVVQVSVQCASKSISEII